MDLGALEHMCSNKSLFQTFIKHSRPHYIGLPDGHGTSVSYIGSVKLHHSIILYDVLITSLHLNTIWFKFPNSLHN